LEIQEEGEANNAARSTPFISAFSQPRLLHTAHTTALCCETKLRRLKGEQESHNLVASMEVVEELKVRHTNQINAISAHTVERSPSSSTSEVRGEGAETSHSPACNPFAVFDTAIPCCWDRDSPSAFTE
jgi:hypothetical protein